MAALRQLLSGNEARLEVNLEEMFGVSVPDNSSFRQAVGQAIIDRIRSRTESSLDRNGKRFKNYSDEYADSIEFKAYGKEQNKPNLKQTGEMLSLIDIIEEDEDKIIIGWRDENAAKAHGHITGHVGTVRDFLGLPDSDLASIADRFQDFLGETMATSRESGKSSVGRVADFITGKTEIKKSATLAEIIGGLFGES